MQVVTKGTVYRTYNPDTDDVDEAEELVLEGLVPTASTIFEEDETVVENKPTFRPN